MEKKYTISINEEELSDILRALSVRAIKYRRQARDTDSKTDRNLFKRIADHYEELQRNIKTQAEVEE